MLAPGLAQPGWGFITHPLKLPVFHAVGKVICWAALICFQSTTPPPLCFSFWF